MEPLHSVEASAIERLELVPVEVRRFAKAEGRDAMRFEGRAALVESPRGVRRLREDLTRRGLRSTGSHPLKSKDQGGAWDESIRDRSIMVTPARTLPGVVPGSRLDAQSVPASLGRSPHLHRGRDPDPAREGCPPMTLRRAAL